MSTTDRYMAGRVPVATASAAIASGALVLQEGWVGIAATAMASGGSGWIKTEGVHIIPVPAGVAKGDLLYVDDAAESVALTPTETASGNLLIGKAVGTRDADGKALVKLFEQREPAA